MIKNSYDFLKYLVNNMSPETHNFVDDDLKLLNMVDAYKQSEYFKSLTQKGYIRVYLGYIHICDDGIEFIKNSK